MGKLTPVLFFKYLLTKFHMKLLIIQNILQIKIKTLIGFSKARCKPPSFNITIFKEMKVCSGYKKYWNISSSQYVPNCQLLKVS